MFLGLTAVVALAASAAGLAAEQASAAAPARFTDSARDAAVGVPELATVVVSNDDAGRIRFRVNVADQRRLDRRSAVALYLDTDRDTATGDRLALGADYRLLLDGSRRTFELARWDGAGFDPAAPRETARVSYWSGLSFTIDRRELGDPTGVRFWIGSRGRAGRADRAPNRGTWSYELRAGGSNPPELEAFFFRAEPGRPRAGTTWTVRVDTVRLAGTTTPVRPSAWRCRATLGGRAFGGRGRDGCTFVLPPGARGRRLAVTMTVSYLGTVVSGAVAYRVR